MSALAARRPLVVMLSPALSLLGVFVAAPMALTIWLAFQDWSTETGFGEARFVGLDNFLAIFGPTSVGRDFKGALVNTAPLHARLGRADPAAVGRARTSRLPTAGQGRRDASDHPVLDLYGADDRGRARLVEALFAERGSDQPDARLGRPPARTMAVLAGHRARFDRHPQRLAASRLFHGAGGRGADADPRLAARGGGARRRRSDTPLRLCDPAAAQAHAACSRP